MIVRNPPESWFWSHDIKPRYFGDVVTPGARLQRLSSYGKGERRRFAAVVFGEPGAERSYMIDIDAAAVEAQLRDLRESGSWPVALTVDADDSQRRFSLLLEKESGPATSLHIDLDEAGVRSLLDDRHGLADFITYVVDGARKYAVILEERSEPSWLLTNVTARELDARLAELGATLFRLRSYIEDGQRLFAAVAEKSNVGKGAWWYADIDADTVAGQLDHHDAYPIDLDAIRGEQGVRFTVVMYRGKS
jgi:hypothetical protein